MNANLAYQPSLYDQLCALPDGVTGEILSRQLHTQISGSARHAVAITGLLTNIGTAFDFARNGPGGWFTLHKPEVHFIRDTEVAVPDLAGWRRERMPRVPDGHRFEVVPDWMCEIRRGACLVGRSGGAHAGSFRAARWLLAGIAALRDDAPVCVAPFDAIEFSLADLWA